MRIAACDDEAQILQILKTYIERYGELSSIRFDIDLFVCASDLLKSLNDCTYDAIFLDISMGTANGIELAKEIKQKNRKIPIIFLTGLSQHMQDAFRLHAFDYVLKPITQEQISRILNDLNIPHTYITVLSERQQVVIQLDDILYVETFKNKIDIITDEAKYTTWKPYAEIKEILTEEFCQCHKSYIINMNKIDKRHSNECLLFNSQTIPIGRKFAAEFKEKYLEHLRRWDK